MLDKINSDIIDAMKKSEKEKLATIRLLKGAIEMESINQKKELSNSDILNLITKQIKQRNESIIQFEKANRQDLIDKTNEEITYLKHYLPTQLSNDEVINIIDEAIKEANAVSMKDMGLVMKMITPKISGKADTKEVSELIRKRLKF